MHDTLRAVRVLRPGFGSALALPGYADPDGTPVPYACLSGAERAALVVAMVEHGRAVANLVALRLAQLEPDLRVIPIGRPR